MAHTRRTTRLVHRAARVGWVTVAIASGAVAVGADRAKADSGTCTFSISSPAPTAGPRGERLVSAALRADKCDGTAQPAMSTVCLAREGRPARCRQGAGWGPVVVTIVAVGEGKNYSASGTGQVRQGFEMVGVPVGPVIGVV